MIDITELRIGNLIFEGGEITEVSPFIFNDFDQIKHTLEGIPITPERLERMGFENDQFIAYPGGHKEPFRNHKWCLLETKWTTDFFYLKYGKWDSRQKEWAAYRNGTKLSSIKHIHQLQNIFFDLTGTELTVKDLMKNI